MRIMKCIALINEFILDTGRELSSFIILNNKTALSTVRCPTYNQFKHMEQLSRWLIWQQWHWFLKLERHLLMNKLVICKL